MEDRLLRLLDTEQLSSSKFADVIGVQRSSVSHILTGRNKPSFDFLQKTLRAFPMLNADWLILGQGEMYEGEQGPGGGSLFEQPAMTGVETGRSITPAGDAQAEQSLSEGASGADISDHSGAEAQISGNERVRSSGEGPDKDMKNKGDQAGDERFGPVDPQQEGSQHKELHTERQQRDHAFNAGPIGSVVPPAPSTRSDAKTGKQVRRVILFYDDNSFDAYEQA